MASPVPAASATVCQESRDDPRLLGCRNLGGRQQLEQKVHLEELAAEGRKAAAEHKAREVRPGWARALREAKVRDGTSKRSEVVGALHEGSRVLVAEVCGTKARIQQPLSGWIALSKHTEPVLEQESWQAQEGKLASSWVVSSVLARLSAPSAGAQSQAQPQLQTQGMSEVPTENVEDGADAASAEEPLLAISTDTDIPVLSTSPLGPTSGSSPLPPTRSWWAALRQAVKDAFRCAGWCR
ncbi:unnamed protein product [Symbiodinium natans]|uniref:Uncharacterized protein n=1 Tax=Symbiodinium natans TaxID=878477 RepID=A0A812QRN7_9DINO|nr:unnamed protein product [Symbiodinium natans]